MYDVKTIQLLSEIERCSSEQEMMELGYALLGNPMFFQNIELGISCYTKSIPLEAAMSSGISGLSRGS